MSLKPFPYCAVGNLHIFKLVLLIVVQLNVLVDVLVREL